MACLSVTARKTSRIGHPDLSSAWLCGASIRFDVRHPMALDWTRHEIGSRLHVRWIEQTLDITVRS